MWIIVILLEVPSSLISIVLSIVLEFALIRPLGYQTGTIGDKEKFTSDDALPKPFFLDDQYDMAELSKPGAASTILVQAIMLAAVGCIESLMTAEARAHHRLECPLVPPGQTRPSRLAPTSPRNYPC